MAIAFLFMRQFMHLLRSILIAQPLLGHCQIQRCTVLSHERKLPWYTSTTYLMASGILTLVLTAVQVSL